MGAGVAGLILSGGNDDGVGGLKRIAQAGGIVLVQDPASAAVSQMPRAALEALRPDFVGSPEALAARLIALAMPNGQGGPDARKAARKNSRGR
jgi:two-component system chemotaxis response regulator CheB